MRTGPATEVDRAWGDQGPLLCITAALGGRRMEYLVLNRFFDPFIPQLEFVANVHQRVAESVAGFF